MQDTTLQRAGEQRCAIYTRKSTDDRLERDYNSLESQRDICSAYVRSQRHKGWIEIAKRYDDPARSGGTLERPGLQRLMDDVERGTVKVIRHLQDRPADAEPRRFRPADGPVRTPD